MLLSPSSRRRCYSPPQGSLLGEPPPPESREAKPFPASGHRGAGRQGLECPCSREPLGDWVRSKEVRGEWHADRGLGRGTGSRAALPWLPGTWLWASWTPNSILDVGLDARRGETTSLDNLQAQSSTLNMKIFRAWALLLALLLFCC